MSQLLTSTRITNEAVRVLKNTLSAARVVNRQYSKEFAQTGAKIGYTVNVRKPPRYIGRTGQAAKLEGTVDSFVPLTLTTQFGVDLPFSMADRTLSLDNFSDRVLKPAMATIANKVDSDILALGQRIPNCVGSFNTAVTALSTYFDAGALLSDLGAPRDADRHVIMTPQMHASGASGALTYFNPQKDVSEQYRTGLLGQIGGFKFWEDQNCPTQTVGTVGGSPLCNGTDQTGSSLIIDAAGSSSFNVGDIITIGSGATGVYSVNPQSRVSTGRLRQFVVTAASAASASQTLSIFPAIVAAGQFQNVDKAAPDNASVNQVYGTTGASSRYGLALHKDAIVMAMVDLEIPPKGVIESARVADEDAGISLALVTAFDPIGGQTITRIECLYGVAIVYEDLACRIWGT